MTKDYVPPHFSYSALSSYMKCGHQYYLQKIARVPEIPSWWFVGGRAVHTMTEIYDLDRKIFLESGLDQLWTKVFTAEVEAQTKKFPDLTVWQAAGKKKARPDGEDYLVWMDQGPVFVQNYIDWREDTGWQIASFYGEIAEDLRTPNEEKGVELPIDVQLAGWALKGSIDRVFITPDKGNLIVVDLKTGSRMPENDLQLGTYAVGMELQYGERPQLGAYFNPRQSKMSQVYNLDGYTVDYMASLGIQLRSAVRSKVFLPHKTNLCNYCPVKKGCATFGGEDAHLYQIEKVLADD